MHFYAIKEAIREGSRVRLVLADGECIVEPHLLGRNRRGDTLVRVYQVPGPKRTEGWRLLRLEKIEQVVETGESFRNPRPGYRPRDPQMTGGIIESI